MIPESRRLRTLAISAFTVLASVRTSANPVWTTSGPPSSYVSQILTDPRSPLTLLVVGHGGLFKSQDGGSHWTSSMAGLPAVGRIVIDPINSSTLLASNPVCDASDGSCSGVYRSVD